MERMRAKRKYKVTHPLWDLLEQESCAQWARDLLERLDVDEEPLAFGVYDRCFRNHYAGIYWRWPQPHKAPTPLPPRPKFKASSD